MVGEAIIDPVGRMNQAGDGEPRARPKATACPGAICALGRRFVHREKRGKL